MKTFYLFRKITDTDPNTPQLEHVRRFEGTVLDARKALAEGEGYEDGEYLILEDTTGPITKKTVSKAVLDFEIPAAKKRPRSSKPLTEPAPARKAKAVK